MVAGETVLVPPVAFRVKLLPSEPVRVTELALVAVAVRTEEAPEAIDDGFALRAAVGGGTLARVPPDPQPPIASRNGKQDRKSSAGIIRNIAFEDRPVSTLFSLVERLANRSMRPANGLLSGEIIEFLDRTAATWLVRLLELTIESDRPCLGDGCSHEPR